jgi:hypothetical protein
MTVTWKAGHARVPRYRLIAFMRSPRLQDKILETNTLSKTRDRGAYEAALVVVLEEWNRRETRSTTRERMLWAL